MKKIILTAAALFLMANTWGYACDQCDKNADQQAKDTQAKIEKMTKDLHLTDVQKTQYETILSAKMERKAAAQARMKDEMKSIHDEYTAKVQGILDADQKVMFEKIMADRDAKKCAKKCKKKKRFFLF